jgi:adenosylmethionine-8-amino-7-oxononanoate aminotransferase
MPRSGFIAGSSGLASTEMPFGPRPSQRRVERRPERREHLVELGPGDAHRRADHPLVGEARSLGLMGALELAPAGTKGFAVPGKIGPRVAAELVERGVITRAVGDALVFCPPMIISEAELDEMFAPLAPALDVTLDWARAEGHLG